MICRFCNHEIPEASKFCQFCGKDQEDHAEIAHATTDSSFPKRRMMGVKFLVPVLVIILLVGAVLAIQRGITSHAAPEESIPPDSTVTETVNLEELFGLYSSESSDTLLLTVEPGENNEIGIRLEDGTETIFNTSTDAPTSHKFCFVADSLSSSIAAKTMPLAITYSAGNILLEPAIRVIGGRYHKVGDGALNIGADSDAGQTQIQEQKQDQPLKAENLDGTRWESRDSEGNYASIAFVSDDGVNYFGEMTVRLATGFTTGCSTSLNINGDSITLSYYDNQWGMTWDVALAIDNSKLYISADLQSDIGVSLKMNNEEMSLATEDWDMYSDDPNPIDTLTDEQLFKYRRKLENNTQNFSLDELMRSPYNFNSYYRFSGSITYINQNYDSGRAHGILELREDGTSVTFDYPGSMECKVGDEIVLYGTFSGPGKYTSTNTYGAVKTIQTANIDGLLFFRKDSYEVKTYLTNYEAEFISGTYFTTDSPREMERQLTITPDTINGRNYTITSVQYTFKYDTYDYNSAGEAVYVAVKTTNERGDEVLASFSFDLNGSMSYMATKGTNTSIYNFDTGSYTRT